MAFPATPLPVKVELALGADLTADPATWTWTDVSAYVRYADRIRYSVGRPDGASSVDSASCTIRLDNRDGRFTPSNPLGAYYGQLKKNTPIRVRVDGGGGYVTRFSGYVAAWPTRWSNKRGNDSTVPVRAYGILQRLAQGKSESRSAMRRTILGSGPVAYWPLEDGSATTQAGSALPGQAPMTITGTAPFDDIDTWMDRSFTVQYGTAALVDVSKGATLTAALPADVTAATASGFTLHVACDLPDSSGFTSGQFVLLEIDTPGGTYVRWQLVLVGSTYDVQVVAYDSVGTATVVCTDTSPLFTMWSHTLVIWQNGANISAGYLWDSSAGYEASGSVAGTLAGVTAVRVNSSGQTATDPLPVGHLALWAGQALTVIDGDDGPVLSSLFGHVWTNLNNGAAAANGEAATTRLARLAAEDGVSLSMPAVSAQFEQRMGFQPISTSNALYQQVEDADQGILYENGFGLGYTPREFRYNPPVAMALDFAQGHINEPPEPTDDDQQLRNRWTVTRTNGSSAVAQDSESVAELGLYESSVTVNHVTDSALQDHASWRVHLGTVEEMRWPRIVLNLARTPELISQWLACGVGSRITIANLPDQVAGENVDLIIEGYTETIGQDWWTVELNCSPAQPWLVAEVSGSARVDSDSSVLGSDVTSSATSIVVASDLAEQWTTDAGEFPLDILFGGEKATVTAISQAFSDTFTRTVSNGWGTAGTGQVWTTNLGAASDYSVSSGMAKHSLGSVNVFRQSFIDIGSRDATFTVDITNPLGTPTGAPVTHWVAGRAADPSNYYAAQLAISTSGSVSLFILKRVGGALSAALGTASGIGTHSSSTWRVVLDVYGSTLRAKAWKPATDADPGWQITVTDTELTAGTQVGVLSRLETGNTNTLPVVISYDNAAVTNLQKFSVTRSVNGVVKAQTAGTQVNVANPAVIAL